MKRVMSVRLIARSIRFQHHPELTACWIWVGSMSHGQAIACIDGAQESARRAVYRHFRGCIPDGNLMPQCRNRLCVNPSHMEKL